jgi:hypothetical protein
MIMSPGSSPTSPSPRTKVGYDRLPTWQTLNAQHEHDNSRREKLGRRNADQQATSGASPPSLPVSPVSPLSGTASPVPGFAEFEGSPPMPSQASFHHKPRLLHTRQTSNPIQETSYASHDSMTRPANLPHNRSISYSGNTPQLIRRKPVGSGISPRTSPTRSSDHCRTRIPECPSDVGIRPMSMRTDDRHARSYVSGGSRQQPCVDTQSLACPLSPQAENTAPGSYPSEAPPAQSNGSPSKSGQRPKPTTRTKTITDIQMHRQRLDLRYEDGGGRDEERNASYGALTMMRKRNALPMPLAMQGGEAKKPLVVPHTCFLAS